MAEQLDIVKLIEKNPIIRLSQDYQSSLLNKIKNKFTEGQQQLFVASFYCYLNYNSKNEFIIDLDDVWKWVGFSRKDPAKRLLTKDFIEKIDYKILLPLKEEQVEKHGGNNKEQILLTINTFKKFCLKAGTKKADEIHEYYIRLEELLQETLNEETDELRKQLMIKDKIIESNEKQNKLDRHQLLIDKFNNKRCVYIAEIVENKYIKIGSTKDINARIKNFRRDYKNSNILFLDVFECQNFREVEENILQDELIRKNLYKGNIAGNCSKEIVELSDNITYKEINETVEKYINSNINLFTPDQLLEKSKIELENKKLEYNLLNNILTNDKYSKTIEQILKDTLPNIMPNMYNNLLNNSNNQIDNSNNYNKNNDIINKVVVDNGKQIKYSYKMIKAIGRKVIQIDPNDLTKIINIYDSITYVIRNPDNLRFSKSELQQAIKNNRVYKGYRWAYVEKGTEPKDIKINPTNKSMEKINGPILELNSDKTLILESYKTQIELAQHLKITKERLRKIIINGLQYDTKYYIEFDKCPKEMINKYNKPINAKLSHNTKSIKQINPMTNEVVIFKSLHEISERLGISHSTIHKAIEKKHLHCGFLWEYYTKDDNNN